MNDEKEEMDPYLGELLFQLQGSAWIHMGKVANPVSGKVERNLEAARGAIDMLGMLEVKTRGNLTKMEEGVLRDLLQQVRLNFVSEQEKGDSPAEPAAASEGNRAADSSDADAKAQKVEPPEETSGGSETRT